MRLVQVRVGRDRHQQQEEVHRLVQRFVYDLVHVLLSVGQRLQLDGFLRFLGRDLLVLVLLLRRPERAPLEGVGDEVPEDEVEGEGEGEERDGGAAPEVDVDERLEGLGELVGERDDEVGDCVEDALRMMERKVSRSWNSLR